MHEARHPLGVDGFIAAMRLLHQVPPFGHWEKEKGHGGVE